MKPYLILHISFCVYDADIIYHEPWTNSNFRKNLMKMKIIRFQKIFKFIVRVGTGERRSNSKRVIRQKKDRQIDEVAQMDSILS